MFKSFIQENNFWIYFSIFQPKKKKNLLRVKLNLLTVYIRTNPYILSGVLCGLMA